LEWQVIRFSSENWLESLAGRILD